MLNQNIHNGNIKNYNKNNIIYRKNQNGYEFRFNQNNKNNKNIQMYENININSKSSIN